MGATACDKGVKSTEIGLILLDEGASERTKKDIRNMCAYYHVQMIITQPAGMLARRCGRDGIMMVGIKDAGFINRLLEIANSNSAEV